MEERASSEIPPTAMARIVHLMLGEYALAHDMHPDLALWHFRAAARLYSPQSSEYVIAAYDCVARLRQRWTYDDDGNVINHVTTYSGLQAQTISCTYNPDGSRTTMSASEGGSILSDFGSMTCDALGNRTAMTATIPAVPAIAGAISYSYDSRNEILNETSVRNGGYSSVSGTTARRTRRPSRGSLSPSTRRTV